MIAAASPVVSVRKSSIMSPVAPPMPPTSGQPLRRGSAASVIASVSTASGSSASRSQVRPRQWSRTACQPQAISTTPIAEDREADALQHEVADNGAATCPAGSAPAVARLVSDGSPGL